MMITKPQFPGNSIKPGANKWEVDKTHIYVLKGSIKKYTKARGAQNLE